MFPAQFTDLQFYQKKKDMILYKAADDFHHYFLKCIITEKESVKQAFRDEYETFHQLSHPSIPVYYGLKEDFLLPDGSQALALCMEYCEGIPLPSAAPFFTLHDLLNLILQTGYILEFLLENGVLYTDLHPSNLLVHPMPKEDRDVFRLVLLDYTYCYYFLKNPSPPYPLRFSYNLSPSLRGQQLLIQELTFLFHALLELKGNSTPAAPLPFSVCTLLETGFHPSDTLLLKEYLLMVKECII